MEMRSPQSPGASSLVKVRNSAPLQQSAPAIVLEVVELVEVEEEVVAPGTVEEVVAPGTVVEVVEVVVVDVVPAGIDVLVVAEGPPGQLPAAGAPLAMKRPTSFRRTVPPNCAQ